MKKTGVYFLPVLAIVFSLHTAVPVHAATWTDVLQAAAARDARVAQVAQYITDVQTGNSYDAAAKEVLTQKVLEKTGVSGGMGAGVPMVSAAQFRAAVQNAVQQRAEEELQQRIQNVSTQLGPYQDRVTALQTLLQQTGLLPQSVQDSNSLPGAPQNYQRVLNMTATAYAPGAHDNGHWGDLTYTGGKVRKGVAAVDPSVIPMGSKLWVEGYGYATAIDQGSAIKGNRIDLAFNDLTTAQDYGIQNVKVYVLN